MTAMAAVAAAALATELTEANAEMAAAGLPVYPGGEAANFKHNLEHIIGISQANQRSRITSNAGITQVEDMLLVDEDTIMETINYNYNE